MSVRRRTWTNRDGSPSEAWVVDYVDQHGDRHLKTFAKKRDADAHHAIVAADVAAGPTPPTARASPSPRPPSYGSKAGEAAGLERSTLAATAARRAATSRPILGALRLSQLTVPVVRVSRTGCAATRSPPWCAKCSARSAASSPTRRSAGWWRRTSCAACGLAGCAGKSDAPTRERQAQCRRRYPVTRRDPRDHRLLDGRCRPLLLTAIFTGLRASELRGLRWNDVDLKRGELHVRQRADRYGKIGAPKSEAGERTVPLPPMLVNALRDGARLTQGRAWPRLPQRHRRDREPPQHREARFPSRRRSPPVSSTATAERNTRACTACATSTPAVHQPSRRWRARTAAQAGAGSPRSRLDPDDGGQLRPPIPERRRRWRAGGSRACVPHLGRSYVTSGCTDCDPTRNSP